MIHPNCHETDGTHLIHQEVVKLDIIKDISELYNQNIVKCQLGLLKQLIHVMISHQLPVTPFATQ